MKGRFSGIFEHWNLRNTEYYQRAFSRLEKENKTTFNIAAGIFSTLWLIFRKMYGFAILLSVALGILALVFPDASGIMFCVAFVGFGFFGNNLYYRHVKSQVSKGYADMPSYNSIDPVWSLIIFPILAPLISIALSLLFAIDGSTLLFIFVQMLFIAIPWAIDYKKFHSQELVEPAEVTEKSVSRYLQKSNPKHVGTAVGIICCLSVVFAFALKKSIENYVAPGRPIAQKIHETSEKLGKDIIDDILKEKFHSADR